MEKYALLFVATSNYYLYTQTAIYSFLKNNEWFSKKEHDILIVIYEEMDDFNKNEFLKLYKNIKFIYLDENNPYKKLQDLYCEKCGKENNYRRLFEKFIIFNLPEYNKILYLDVDILVLHSLKYMFENDYLYCTNFLPNEENFFNYFQLYNLYMKPNFMYNIDNSYISFKKFMNTHGFSTLGTCTGIMLFNSNLHNNIFDLENMYNYVLNCCNNERTPPKQTIEETFLNYYLQFLTFNNYIGDEIALLPATSCGYVSSDSYCYCFNTYIFNTIDNDNKILNELNRYDVLHYFNKPWYKGVDIYEIPYKLWYKYLYETLCIIKN